MGIGGKIKKALMGPLNKMLGVLMKPIQLVLGLIMNIINLLKNTFKSFFLYIKCVIKLLVNFHKCVWYYILDAIKYLIQSVILFFVVTIAGLSQQNVKKAVKNTNKFFSRMKYSNGVMNDCYRCKPKGGKKSPSILDMLKKMIADQLSPTSKDEPISFFTLFLFCIIFFFIGLFVYRFFFDPNTRTITLNRLWYTIFGLLILFIASLIGVFIYDTARGKDEDMDGADRDDEGDSQRKQSKNRGYSFMFVFLIILLGCISFYLFDRFIKLVTNSSDP
jgi:hypothetical protein